MSSTNTLSAVPALVDERYADLADRRLAAALSTEDAAEESGLDPLERTTCYTQLTGDVALTCPKCHQMPAGAANRQLVRCCRASLAAAHDDPPAVGTLPEAA